MARIWILVLLVLSISLNVVGAYMYFSKPSVIASHQSLGEAEKAYPLLAKSILQGSSQDLLINFYPLRKELLKLTEPYDTSFGLYFEYLPTGTSIGINANEEFYAASLFKVPVVMAYYHGIERKGITEDPLIEIKEEHLDKEFGDLWKSGAGTKIKASEAVRLSLVESDNTAIKALLPHIEKEDFDAVYNGIDLELHTGQDGALVSARMYSTILKALHFSSVLSKENSQELLDMLTKTKFSDKLVAGVPSDVVVAHKIGSFKVGEGDQEAFRDCGIVYEPRRPYILCMFSVGDEQTARDRMQAMSKKIYDYVTSAK
jgi:beta-lactamase class A